MKFPAVRASHSSKEGMVRCNLLHLWVYGRPAPDLSKVIKIMRCPRSLSLLRAVSHLHLPRHLKKILIRSKIHKLLFKPKKFWSSPSQNHLKLLTMLKTTFSLRWEKFLAIMKIHIKKSMFKTLLWITAQLLTLPISKCRSICVVTKPLYQYSCKPAESKAQYDSPNLSRTTQPLNTLLKELLQKKNMQMEAQQK